MTQWIAYVPTGQEFALVEDCWVLGVEAIAPRKVEAVRTGNRRYPEPRVTPYLGNYVFITASADEWHWLKNIRYLRSIMGVPPGEERKVRSFCEMVEAQYAVRMAEIEQAAAVMLNRVASKEARREALRVMQSYTPGDLLEVICGPFAGTVMAFGRMVERGAVMAPEIEATMTLFGRESTVRLDPLSIKKAG
ncbi:MAG: hypothetical protein RIS17_1550 [Pseudomonadota bacterium]